MLPDFAAPNESPQARSLRKNHDAVTSHDQRKSKASEPQNKSRLLSRRKSVVQTTIALPIPIQRPAGFRLSQQCHESLHIQTNLAVVLDEYTDLFQKSSSSLRAQHRPMV